MLTNDQMIRNRYGKWFLARRKLAFITDALNGGRTVCVATPYKVTRCSKKHVGIFSATRNGLFMGEGKGKVCIDGCKLIVE